MSDCLCRKGEGWRPELSAWRLARPASFCPRSVAGSRAQGGTEFDGHGGRMSRRARSRIGTWDAEKALPEGRAFSAYFRTAASRLLLRYYQEMIARRRSFLDVCLGARIERDRLGACLLDAHLQGNGLTNGRHSSGSCSTGHRAGRNLRQGAPSATR